MVMVVIFFCFGPMVGIQERDESKCAYDNEPLGFEKDPLETNKKMQAQDPLEEAYLGEGADYNEMSGLSRDMVELKLPIRPGKKLVKQLS